jgi:hypothetical protein
MTSNSYFSMGIIITVILIIIFLGANLVMSITRNDAGEIEYQHYVNIRDASNCTKANDTFCKEEFSICIHGYESCQRTRCPGDIR